MAGFRTILVDILPSSLRQAQSELRDRLHRATTGGSLSAAEVESAMQRLAIAGSVADAARDADLVIEAVPDELESKLEIFTLLDKLCRPETILASNTSTLSITEIASVTYRPQKCIVMRFTSPVHAMTRLELVCGRETDEATVGACVEVGRKMGKTTVIST